jgi:hypothetical protein
LQAVFDVAFHRMSAEGRCSSRRPLIHSRARCSPCRCWRAAGGVPFLGDRDEYGKLQEGRLGVLVNLRPRTLLALLTAPALSAQQRFQALR